MDKEIMMRRRWTALTAAPLLLVMLAGCGSGGGDEGIATANGGGPAAATATSGPSGSSQDQGLQLAQCLRRQGLDVQDPDPGSGIGSMIGSLFHGQNIDPSRLQQALQACQQFTSGAGGHSSEGLSAADRQKMLDYTRCLRQHGIDIGDPDPQTGRPPASDLQKLFDQDDPKLRDAQAACQQFAPQGGGGNG
jgi:hypothetical protein